MKREFYFLCLLTLVFVQHAMAQAPTVPASNVTFSTLEGGSVRMTWTSGNGARRIVIAREGSPVTAIPSNGVDYNASLTLGLGDAILPGQFVIYDAAGSNTSDILALQPATTYHFAIFEYNGTGASTQYLTSSFVAASQATLSAPTLAATNIVFSNITGSSMTLTWTNGNGTRRIVVARAGSPVNANPADLSFYSGNASFGVGNQIGTGNYAVYSNTGNSVTITNLQPSTTYHFAIYEFNGSSLPVYLITAPAIASQPTQVGPNIPASGASFTQIDGSTMRISWTAGNGSRRIVVMRTGTPVTAVPVNGTDYAENLNFNTAAEISPGQRVVYDNIGANTSDITNLLPNTVYHFRVYEYDGTGAGISYLTSSFLAASQSTATTPTTQASAAVISNVTGNSFTIGWANGNGARRLVLVKAGSPVDASPVDLTFYSAVTAFGSGAQIGTGNYVVYNNTGSTVNITNLSPGIIYHVAVFEYNGSSTPVYNTTNPATVSQLTATSPTVPASGVGFTQIDGNSMRVDWTSGNGARRIVVIRAGSPVTAVPSDGVDYAESLNFNLAAEISPGERVVYDGVSTNTSDITNLLPNTVYHFRIYEYNGTGASIDYLTALFAAASQSTSTTPTTQASNMSFTNISGSSVTVNWTNGNGAGRIVVARAGSPVNTDPSDLSFYSANTSFGTGTQIGTGNYVVFSANTGTTVTVTNLNPGITYHFSIYEYNGSSARVYATPALTGNVTTLPAPTIASSGMAFSQIEGNAMRTNWTSGNGTRRIVVIRAGSPVTAVPVNGTDYAESLNFNLAAEISPGERVVYDGASTNTSDITNLLPNTVYHFRIYEYDGTGSAISYLTSSFASGSQSTSTTPLVQASNITFTSVAATSVIVNWTVGDGTRRLLVGRQGNPVNTNPVDLVFYSSNANFGVSTPIGTGNYPLTTSNATNVTINGLTSGTTYHFALYEQNGSSAPVYRVPGTTGIVTTLGAPQIQAINASAGSLTSNSMQISWTNGSGNRRLVLMKQGSAVDATPVNNTAYTANTFFGSGTQLGAGNYVVYNNTGTSVTVTNLLPNTTYHFAVFEFNDFGATSQFLLTNPAIGNGTTSIAPLPVTFIDFDAENDRNNIKLKWSTAQELNSSHFELQKAARNNPADFMTFSHVNAAGESFNRLDYSYTDEAPFSGVSYYRIRQVDRDGRFLYSKTVSVTYQPKGLIKKWISPIQNGVFIQLTSFTPGTRNEWRLYDMQGRIVHREQFSSQTIYGAMPAITAGTYILEVRMGDSMERIKIYKAN
jgi:hypothetical protein